MGLFDGLFGPSDSEQDWARAEARRARIDQKKAKRQFEEDLSEAEQVAMQDAISYFEDMGLDPAQYMPDIERAIAQTRSSVPRLAGNVGSYFDDLGESVYGDLSERGQRRSLSSLNSLFPGAAGDRISDSLDDAIIEEILGESRVEADTYLQNLLDRGVITQSGFDAGARDLQSQMERARGQLGEIGSNILGGGRESLDDILNQGRLAASGLSLGQSFDPNYWTGKIDAAFQDFTNNLGSKFRSQIPGNLFETSGLPARAGAAMGPQNTKFSSNALAGILEEDDEDEEDRYAPVF